VKRRTILGAASGALAAYTWPLVPARAERPLEIGWVSYFRASDAAPYRTAFLDGLRERGLVQGRDFNLVERYADQRIEIVDGFLTELGSRDTKLIVTYGPAVKRAIDAKLHCPTLFAFSGDAVDAGFTSSLARPDRNATGIAYLAAELNAKRIEILSEILPDLRRVALLSNPLHPGEQKELTIARAAASRRGMELVHLAARDGVEIERALAHPSMEAVGALIVLSDILTVQNRLRIVETASRRRLPVVAGMAMFARSGCLFSYGPVLAEVYRRLADLAERLLRGTRAAELPVEQPTRFELVLNLKAAAALGLTLPAAVLAIADEVIE
jgi:putative tryptophan/tyrosine transport system substrate-binding protein